MKTVAATASTARCFVSRNGVQLPVAVAPSALAPRTFGAAVPGAALADDRTARAFAFTDEDDAIREILDEPAARLPAAGAVARALPARRASWAPLSISSAAVTSPTSATSPELQ